MDFFIFNSYITQKQYVGFLFLWFDLINSDYFLFTYISVQAGHFFVCNISNVCSVTCFILFV